MKVYECYPEPTTGDAIAAGFRHMFPTKRYLIDQLRKQINPHPRTPKQALSNRAITNQITELEREDKRADEPTKTFINY